MGSMVFYNIFNILILQLEIMNFTMITIEMHIKKNNLINMQLWYLLDIKNFSYNISLSCENGLTTACFFPLFSFDWNLKKIYLGKICKMRLLG